MCFSLRADIIYYSARILYSSYYSSQQRKRGSPSSSARVLEYLHTRNISIRYAIISDSDDIIAVSVNEMGLCGGWFLT